MQTTLDKGQYTNTWSIVSSLHLHKMHLPGARDHSYSFFFPLSHASQRNSLDLGGLSKFLTILHHQTISFECNYSTLDEYPSLVVYSPVSLFLDHLIMSSTFSPWRFNASGDFQSWGDALYPLGIATSFRYNIPN